MSKTTISTITDKVMDGMAEWQSRPLDRVYPVRFLIDTLALGAVFAGLLSTGGSVPVLSTLIR